MYKQTTTKLRINGNIYTKPILFFFFRNFKTNSRRDLRFFYQLFLLAVPGHDKFI